jgi:class 3 adenylate cyclase/tetratricopeptide (TPR) repeat protein
MAMREAMTRVGLIRTPGGTEVQLGMKVAVAVGDARRFVVGDPDIQLIDVLAGRLIDELADAEHYAEKGDIVLDRSAVAALGDRVTLGERRGDGQVALLRELHVPVEAVPAIQPPPLPEELARQWLLPAVYERLKTGRGEFLAELRPAHPVFIRFTGIDYDEDDDAIEQLDGFVRQAQRIFAGFGGNVLQLTLGDKGAYLYGVFGSPIAHEDDAARAAAAALELRDLGKTTAARDLQIGVTVGRLRSGTYGHAMRRTFVCLGDAVNLAARLMSKAPTGGVYVSAPVREAAGDAFIWHELEDLTVKGKAAPIAAFALTGSLERASRRRLRFELPLAGRLDELALLEDRLSRAVAGERRIVGIAAEAGMGKSRLVAAFVRSARRAERTVVFGECQSFGTTTPYFVWREIWRRLLDVDEQQTIARQRKALGRRIGRIDAALVARLPLLGAVLGLDIADTDLTASFDAKLRKTSLEDLLSRCFQARAAEEPVVVVLEDAHWIDELSRDLLETLVRASADLPVLFLLAYRPAATPGGDLHVERLGGFDEVAPAELSSVDAAQLVRTKVEQLVGADVEPPAALVERITERSEGNPLYIEELVGYLAGQGADLGDATAVAAIDLPESLHSLVLSRIDTVPEEPRRTLKVASVIGRVFRAPVLPEVYPDLGALDAVRGHLGTLRGADLVRLDREAEEAYLFKHVVTQEVAYASMPFAVRATLHRLAGAQIERTAGEALDQQLDLLAHHYWHSDDDDKKVVYLGRAADAAQEAYANTAAVDYLERLLPLVTGVARVEVLLKLARILTLVGDLGRAGEVGREARAAAEAEGDVSSTGWTEVALGEVARRQGRFDEAVERLRAAERDFTSIGEDAGVGRALHLLGTVSSQRGAHDDAERIYRESAAIRERIGDRASLAAIWTNLGIVADQRGDFAASRAFNEQALAIHRELGNRWGIANALNNVAVVDVQEGRLDIAKDLGTEAVRGLAEIGDAQMLAIARHSLANVYRALGDGDEARPLFAASLETYRRLDDRWGLAFLLEDIGILVAHDGDPQRALELLGAADRIRKDDELPRAPGHERELQKEFDAVRAALGEAAEPARERGQAWALEEALERAEEQVFAA